MKLPRVQRYLLRLKPGRKYEVFFSGEDRRNFREPATKVCGKLYVMMQDSEIHYVGITNRPMSARINYGLKATGNRGYHGYHWKQLKGDLSLLVWPFNGRTGQKFIRELETIEAEFAYLVRHQTGRWPLSQTEIHFYDAKQEHKAAAEEMMEICRESRG